MLLAVILGLLLGVFMGCFVGWILFFIPSWAIGLELACFYGSLGIGQGCGGGVVFPYYVVPMGEVVGSYLSDLANWEEGYFS